MVIKTKTVIGDLDVEINEFEGEDFKSIYVGEYINSPINIIAEADSIEEVLEILDSLLDLVLTYEIKNQLKIS